MKSTKTKVMTIIALALILYALTFIPHIHQRINSIATETESYTSTSPTDRKKSYWEASRFLNQEEYWTFPVAGL